MNVERESLASQRRMAWHVGWNLVAAGVPLLVAVAAVPRLVAALGPSRFGLLGLIWAAVGYFTVFDLGFGRALTKLAAERLGDGREHEIRALAITGLRTIALSGLAVGVCLAAASPWIGNRFLSAPAELRHEAVISFAISALLLPIVLSTAGLVGILQAYQRFVAISIVQMALGVANFAGPLIALRVSRSLITVTIVLGASRLVACLTYWILCRRVLIQPSDPPPAASSLRRELLRFGGWVTVSNIVGPMMVYMDRFLVAALLTMSAVAYYTTPYDMVTRLWVLAEALIAVVFPAIATALPRGGSAARVLFLRATRAMMLLMLVPTGLTVLFAAELLALWLGVEFAHQSAAVLRWLAIGVLLNSLARLPFTVLHASGRPDLTAKLHVIELPVYLFTFWVLTRTFGIVGAAAAWTFRSGLDAGVLFLYGLRVVPQMRGTQLHLLAYIAAALILLVAFSLTEALWMRGFGAVTLLIAASYFSFIELRRIILGPEAVAAS